jgi:hypothetical protein
MNLRFGAGAAYLVLGCASLCSATSVHSGVPTFSGQTPPANANPARQQAETDSPPVPARLKPHGSTGDVRCDLNRYVGHGDMGVSPKGDRVVLTMRGEAIPGDTKDEHKCRVTWIARFKVDGTWRSVTASTRDDEWNREHYFRIVGWSADGERLLMSITSASGDWDETNPVVYDLRRDRIWTNELANVFAPINPDNCALHFRPVGFDAAGEIVLDVGTLGPNREALGQKSCFEQSRWKYDFTRGTVERAEDGLLVEKFGTVVPHK